ncbi:MAG: hypothetical protein WC975_01290 [Phycisphaerae bacterium]
MTQINSERQSSSHASLRTWFFNPFYYVAGGHALLAGLILILLADDRLLTRNASAKDPLAPQNMRYRMPMS